MVAVSLLGLTLAASFGHPSSISPRTCAAVVEEYAGDLALVDAGGTVKTRVHLGLEPHEIAIGSNGRNAYVSLFGIKDYDHRIGTPGKTVEEVDLESARIVRRYRLPNGLSAPHGVGLRPGRSHELFTNAEVGRDTMVVFDKKTGRLLRRFPIQEGSHNFVFSPNGRSVYVFSGTGIVVRYDAASGQRLARTDIGSPIRGLHYSVKRGILASARGNLFVLSPSNLAIVIRMKSPVPGQLLYPDEWPDGTIIAPSLDDGGMVVFNRGGGTRFVATGKTPVHVQRGADGLAYVTNVDDDHMTIVDPRSSAVHSWGPFNGANGLALLPCGGARQRFRQSR